MKTSLGFLWGCLLWAAGLSLSSARSPVAFTPICAIQGGGASTPFAGQTLTTQGVVFADLDQTSKKGFYLQHSECDTDPSTSDGIFVYLGSTVNVVNVGDLVEVSGVAQEYYGMTEIATSPSGVSVLSSGNPLPAPSELNPPFDGGASAAYLEAREGMSVHMPSAIVVGPTDAEDQTWAVAASLGINHVFYDDPSGTGEIVCIDDGGLYEITPEAAVGDLLTGLSGWLEYSHQQYRLQLLSPPLLTAAGSPSLSAPPSGSLTIAAFNLHDFFDTVDDPITQDEVLSGAAYQRKVQKLALTIHALGEPTVLGVQEAENSAVLNALAGRAEIDADYGAVLFEGPDPRGIDVGLLYRLDAVTAITATVRQACTTLQDGLGPDGNGDVLAPQNALTCDTDGDGLNDGNRLFARPPLLAHLVLNRQPFDLWVIVNHWKSKLEDTDTTSYTLPRRLAQAQWVAALADEILSSHPGANLIVLGDLNDTYLSQPLNILQAAGLQNLWLQVPKTQRYSYIRQGISQELDHILASAALDDTPHEFLCLSPWHANADYPLSYETFATTERRSSDHDPLVLTYSWIESVPRLYLPLVGR